MNSPFTDFAEIQSDSIGLPSTELLSESPFTDVQNDFISPELEEELTTAQLKTAIDLNRQYMNEYGWQDYAKQILRVTGITDDSWITNSREENLESFTKFFAAWQERNGYKTTLPGVFGLNNWTYFQKKIGLNSLGNNFNIDVEKAIAANKKYASSWNYAKSEILKYLNKGLPLNDEYFAYMIAKYQADINPNFNNKIKVDGILGPTTWDILRTYIERANPGFDLKQHVKLNDAKAAAEKYVEVRSKYSSLMINALEKIQSDVESTIRNEPIEFNTVKETIYAVANGIVGAVPIVGAAGNAMLDYNKEYWKNVEDNLNREFDKKRSLKLNDIIYILKNQTVETTSTIVIQHSLEDQLKYSGNVREKIFSDFTSEIERIMRLNQSSNEIMKLAISSLIGAFSLHTRIYVHCRNTTDFKDWSDQDVSNILQDTDRKRLNIRFTRVHPNVAAKENNLASTEVKNLKTLWELFKSYNYTLQDLKVKKDIFFNINLPLSIDYIVTSAKYNVEFSFYLKTLAPDENWSKLKTILNLPYNTYRLPNNRITYNDGRTSVSRSLLDKNNKGLVYEDIFLQIANSVMGNEYNLPSKIINLISNEAPLTDESIRYEDHNNAEIDRSGTENFYFPVNSEDVFTNEDVAAVSGYLSTGINLKRTQYNKSQFQKSGLQFVSLISALNKSVDVQAIRQALLAYNQSNPSSQYNIDNSGVSVVDSVFTEAVHQFQIKNYLNPVDQDGVIGQSTLETLGFVDHGLRLKLSGTGLYGFSQLNRSDVKPQIHVLTDNEFTAANWYQYILKPAWLGVKIADGIHILLYRKLKEAEQWLLAQPQYKGMAPAVLGKTLGFNAATRYSGARLSAAKQAMHGFGLALDINVSGNPWIGAGWVQNDQVLLQERYRMIKVLRNASGDQSLPGSTIFEYLHNIAQSNGKDTRAAYNTLKQRNDEFITYLKNNSSELSYWRNSQSFANRNPLNGFLNLHADLTYALRQVAGLAWGAMDFGPRASGDIMHFDLRTVGVGKFLCEKIGGYVPKNGHPAISGEIASDEINYEMFNDHEFSDQTEFHEAVEEAVGYEDETINEWDQQELDEETEKYNDETINELDQQELNEITKPLDELEEPLMEIDEYADNETTEDNFPSSYEPESDLEYIGENELEAEDGILSSVINLPKKVTNFFKNSDFKAPKKFFQLLIAPNPSLNKLTDEIFYSRHREKVLPGNKRIRIRRNEGILVQEWLDIRNNYVIPIVLEFHGPMTSIKKLSDEKLFEDIQRYKENWIDSSILALQRFKSFSVTTSQEDLAKLNGFSPEFVDIVFKRLKKLLDEIILEIAQEFPIVGTAVKIPYDIATTIQELRKTYLDRLEEFGKLKSKNHLIDFVDNQIAFFSNLKSDLVANYTRRQMRFVSWMKRDRVVRLVFEKKYEKIKDLQGKSESEFFKQVCEHWIVSLNGSLRIVLNKDLTIISLKLENVPFAEQILSRLKSSPQGLNLEVFKINRKIVFYPYRLDEYKGYSPGGKDDVYYEFNRNSFNIVDGEPINWQRGTLQYFPDPYGSQKATELSKSLPTYYG